MSQSGANAIARSGRILAVDDQAANLRVVGILLGRNGYEVIPAANGAEALAAAQAQVPDLILLDMMMPGMDGFELLAALRAMPALRDVPAVFLTAAHDRDLRGRPRVVRPRLLLVRRLLPVFAGLAAVHRAKNGDRPRLGNGVCPRFQFQQRQGHAEGASIATRWVERAALYLDSRFAILEQVVAAAGE